MSHSHTFSLCLSLCHTHAHTHTLSFPSLLFSSLPFTSLLFSSPPFSLPLPSPFPSLPFSYLPFPSLTFPSLLKAWWCIAMKIWVHLKPLRCTFSSFFVCYTSACRSALFCTKTKNKHSNNKITESHCQSAHKLHEALRAATVRHDLSIAVPLGINEH